MRNFTILFYSIGLTILLISNGCKPEDGLKQQSDFFGQAKYNGSFFKNLPLLSVDSSVAQIQKEVPAKWQSYACESTYYHLTSIHENVSDSIQLRYMDAYDRIFSNDSVRAFTQMIRGEIFMKLLRYDTARACLQNSYDLSVKGNRMVRAADVNRDLARLAARENKYPEAIKRFLDTYEVISQLDSNSEAGRTFNILMSLGRVFRESNDFNEAQKWYQKAWVFACGNTKENSQQVLASASMAENYLLLNKIDSAKMMIDTSFYFQRLYNYNNGEASRYMILAKTYLAMENCSEALFNFKEAKSRNKRIENKMLISNFDKGIAESYLCLNRVDSALVFFEKAKESADSLLQANVHDQLSKIYEKKGDKSLALFHERENRKLTNTIFNANKVREIGRLQAKNDAEKLLKEQENELKMSKLYWYISFLILALALGIAVFWIVKQRQKQEILEKEKQIIEVQEQLNKLALLRAEQELSEKESALMESQKLLELKNLLIQELEMKLISQNTLTNEQEAEASKEYNQKLQDLKILTSDDWRRFQELFNNRFPNYVARLNEKYRELSTAEFRLFLLIKIGFDANEIANILGISSDSVYKSRYRLRKKLDLGESQDLDEFIQRF